ncbi:hypothetical protein D7X33_33515 [Butyricicoccus sp. 1XD8-22]|nr:hypothetical protein D7X33_33515 [Butyricicoccus sp. 1XD8-22]
MEKQITVLPIYVEEIKKLIYQYGNTKQILLSLINRYAKGYIQKYPSMSQDEAINNGYDMVENAYNLLKIEIPVN